MAKAMFVVVPVGTQSTRLVEAMISNRRPASSGSHTMDNCRGGAGTWATFARCAGNGGMMAEGTRVFGAAQPAHNKRMASVRFTMRSVGKLHDTPSVLVAASLYRD